MTDVDWSKIVNNLVGGGMSIVGIARRCGMESQTVSRLRSGMGDNPRWRQALALLDLHFDVCREKHSREAIAK